MKKIIMILILGLILVNCDSKTIPKPDNLISEDQMVDILYDLNIISALKNNNPDYLKQNGITPAKYIYEKYKIDSLEFSKSDKYYATDVDEYEKLYQRVTARLQSNKAKIDTLLARNPEVKVNDTVGTTKTSVNRLRDSLRNKRINTQNLFKKGEIKK